MDGLAITLDAVITAVTEEEPRVVTVRWDEELPNLPESISRSLAALPAGRLALDGDRTLELALRRWVREQTGLELGYVEQLYTFGDRFRDPRERWSGPRVVSVAYLALVRESEPTGQASWTDWYAFFPWEDWREGRPDIIDEAIAPELLAWVDEAEDAEERSARRERVDIVFGMDEMEWDEERVLERYELLYEVGLVAERSIDERVFAEDPERGPDELRLDAGLGESMALDHRRILATSIGRLRGKIKYRPVVFELLPPVFTLLQLQRVVEALSGVRLHKPNFRRLVDRGGLVEGTGEYDKHTGGRPAELFRFRREVLRERPAPGVGLPRG